MNKQCVNFEEALNAIKEGKRVGNVNWDEDTFVFMQVPANIPYDVVERMQSLPDNVKEEIKRRYELSSVPYQETFDVRYRGQIAKMMPDCTIQGFSFTPYEVLAKEWLILD